MAEAGLELRGICAGYGGADVLHSVDLELPSGGFVCVVGPNGSGKSTLLAVVSGLLRPRRGEVSYRGSSIAGKPARQILAAGICQIPQRRSAFPQMTVRENVELGGLLLRDHALTRRRREELEARFPLLRERAGDRAGALSGGQQKLVEIARGLMLEPSLMIFDEPSTGLDPQRAAEVYETIAELHAGGRTILLVEQNVRVGLSMAATGLVLEGGRVRLVGSGEELLSNPEMGALYLGGHPASGGTIATSAGTVKGG